MGTVPLSATSFWSFTHPQSCSKCVSISVLKGLQGIFVIADDILITERCRQRNIKLNPHKFEYKCEEVAFIGHRVRVFCPDPEKVAALLDMREPEDVPGVQRFVGMVQYLAKFLPALSGTIEPLRKLTHKDTPWSWGRGTIDRVL